MTADGAAGDSRVQVDSEGRMGLDNGPCGQRIAVSSITIDPNSRANIRSRELSLRQKSAR